MFSPYWTPIAGPRSRTTRRSAVLVPTAAARREGLTAALARNATPRTKVLYWNSPNNPTGRRLLARARSRRSRRSPASAASPSSRTRPTRTSSTRASRTSPIASLPGMSERTITVFTLSKSYSMTGWRLGYVVAPEALPVADQDGRALHDQRRLDADAVGRRRGPRAAARSTSRSGRTGYRARRDRLVAGLRAAGFELETPRAALYLFPKIAVLARRGLARGRADASRRGEDRDGARESSSAPKARATCASRSRCRRR